MDPKRRARVLHLIDNSDNTHSIPWSHKKLKGENELYKVALWVLPEHIPAHRSPHHKNKKKTMRYG